MLTPLKSDDENPNQCDTSVAGVTSFGQCPIQQMPGVSDVVDVLPKVQAMCLADRAMFDRAMRAFVSYVQAYAKHECSLIFRVKGKRRRKRLFRLNFGDAPAQHPGLHLFFFQIWTLRR